MNWRVIPPAGSPAESLNITERVPVRVRVLSRTWRGTCSQFRVRETVLMTGNQPVWWWGVEDSRTVL